MMEETEYWFNDKVAINPASEPPGNKVALRKPVMNNTHNAESENQSAKFSKAALNASNMSYQARSCLASAPIRLVCELQ